MNTFDVNNKTDMDHHLTMTHEIRAQDEGLIEGYIAKWGVVDSYNSRFQKGSFSQTIRGRLDKIRVLFNHDTSEPIGRLLDIQEDDIGVFVRAQLVMAVDKAKDTFNLIKGGAIDSFSFGFRTISDKYEDGVQVITEVVLGEISPVIFPASEQSTITSARSIDNELTLAFNKYISTSSIEEVAQSTSFNIDELRSLQSGEIIAEPNRLTQLNDDIVEAYKIVRISKLESLCNELRAGITPAEATRINALLQKSLHNEADDVIAYMSDFRNKLTGDK